MNAILKATRPRIAFRALAVGILLFSLAACGQTPATTNPVRAIAPEALNDVIGAEDFTGLLVAFAAWCPPCKEELPELAALYRSYKDRGIQMAAMSLDEKPAAVQPLIDRLGIPFPVYWVGNRGLSAYKIVGVPTLMIIKNGKILEKRPGRQQHRELERIVKTLID